MHITIALLFAYLHLRHAGYMSCNHFIKYDIKLRDVSLLMTLLHMTWL